MALEFEIGDKVKVLIDGGDWGMAIGRIGKVVGHLCRDDMQTIEFQGMSGGLMYIGYRPTELEFVEDDLVLEFQFIIKVNGHGKNRSEAWEDAQDFMETSAMNMIYDEAIEVE